MPTKAEEIAAERRARAERRRVKAAKLIHTPTPATRRVVWCMAAAGMEPEDIAGALKVRIKQLQKIYYDELRWGIAKASAVVTEAVYKIATNVDHPQCMQAAKFWLGAKAGWAEKVSIDAKVRAEIEALRNADDEALIEIGTRYLAGAGAATTPEKLH